MVSTILVLSLFISYAQAISSTSEFQASSISESRDLNQSNLQTHQECLERLWYGSTREKNRLVEKVEDRKNEIFETLRKAHGSGGRGGGRGRGSPSGSGTADINRRPNPTRNSATSLLQLPCFGASNLALSVASLAFIFVFLFN